MQTVPTVSKFRLPCPAVIFFFHVNYYQAITWFLLQFGVISTWAFFKCPGLYNFVVFEKLTRACWHQSALEIRLLPILTREQSCNTSVNRPFYSCVLGCQAFDLERGWRWPCCGIDKYLVSITTRQFTFEKQQGLYHNKVNLSFTPDQRLGNQAGNCKLDYYK